MINKFVDNLQVIRTNELYAGSPPVPLSSSSDIRMDEYEVEMRTKREYRYTLTFKRAVLLGDEFGDSPSILETYKRRIAEAFVQELYGDFIDILFEMRNDLYAGDTDAAIEKSEKILSDLRGRK